MHWGHVALTGPWCPHRDSMDSVKQSAALCLLRLYKASPDLVPMGEWTARVVHLLNDQHMVRCPAARPQVSEAPAFTSARDPISVLTLQSRFHVPSVYALPNFQETFLLP